MKLRYLIVVVLVALLGGCKQNNWLDWKAENMAFLEQNVQNDSIQVTPSGLQYRVIRKGIPNAAPRPDELKTVVVTYTGKFINGYVFDSGENVAMTMSSLIEGFREGL